MGVLDAQLHVARETAYGTPITPTRSFEAKADGHKRPPAFLESVGMRPGMQAMRTERRRPINMGAEGAIELDLMNKGLGMFLRAMMGSSAITQQGATAAWLQAHLSTGDGPVGESLTVQLGRPPLTGAVLPFTYHGGKVKTWEVTQAVGDGNSGIGKLRLGMDYEDEDTTTVLAAPAYPSGISTYGWPEFAVTVNAAPVDIIEYSVSGDNNLNTERRRARGSVLKREPLRKGLPNYEGRLVVDFENLTQYDRFRGGTVVPIVATWTGAEIAAGFNFLLRCTLAACQYSGETPEVSLDDEPRQPLPFKVLHNGTDPAVRWEFQSTDTAF